MKPTRHRRPLKCHQCPPVLGAILWALEEFDIPDCRTLAEEGLKSMLDSGAA